MFYNMMAASLEMFSDATRRYEKPQFNLPATEEIVWQKPFCNVIRFRTAASETSPKVLIVAPLSGHYATLLRGTVEAMLPEHDVYITDWADAGQVPLSAGSFDLDDYTDYLIQIIEHLSQEGERISVMAVCQPGVPVLVASSLMAKNPKRPASIILMGSPIDTTRSPQAPNEFAQKHPLSWFKTNLISVVTWPNRGMGRKVYSGFLQLYSFMSMNRSRHIDAHINQFYNLVRGDKDGSEAHHKFYDEYLAVMDLPAEFYLQTIDRVFQQHLLAKGEYRYRGELVDPSQITDIAIMSVEGEKDDITGLGQTEAVHDLTPNLPDDKRLHFVVPGAGHYGIFNGSRWREVIQPMVHVFIRR